MDMLDELRAVLRSIEDARALIVCHPDDEASVRLAVRAVCIIAPDIQIDPWVKPGQALIFPAATRRQAIIP